MRIPITLVASALLVSVACSQDGPTDVQRKSPTATLVGSPSFAAGGGGKPASGYETRTASLNVRAGNSAAFEVLCPSGKRALGGGFKVNGGMLEAPGDVVVYESTPRVTSGTDGWRIEAINRTVDERSIEAHVICAPI
jgi:hypothetical protein